MKKQRKPGRNDRRKPIRKPGLPTASRRDAVDVWLECERLAAEALLTPEDRDAARALPNDEARDSLFSRYPDTTAEQVLAQFDAALAALNLPPAQHDPSGVWGAVEGLIASDGPQWTFPGRRL